MHSPQASFLFVLLGALTACSGSGGAASSQPPTPAHGDDDDSGLPAPCVQLDGGDVSIPGSFEVLTMTASPPGRCGIETVATTLRFIPDDTTCHITRTDFPLDFAGVGLTEGCVQATGLAVGGIYSNASLSQQAGRDYIEWYTPSMSAYDTCYTSAMPICHDAGP